MKKKLILCITAFLLFFGFNDAVKADAGVYSQCTYTYDGYKVVVQEMDDYNIRVGEITKGKNKNKKYLQDLSDPSYFYHRDSGSFYCPTINVLFLGDTITLSSDKPYCDGSSIANCTSYTLLNKVTTSTYANKCAYESSSGEKVIVTADGINDVDHKIVEGKAKFKLDDQVFFTNDIFSCPSEGLAIQTCTKQNGKVTKYWTLANSDYVFCDDDEVVGEEKIHEVEPDEKTKASTWNTKDGNSNAFLKKIWQMLRIIIPVLVIILGVVDFLKVVFLSDEKVYKDAYVRLLKRIGVGIILFLIPALVKLILEVSGLKEIPLYEVFK